MELLKAIRQQVSGHAYPEVPPPICVATDSDSSVLPEEPGIYFVWRGPVVYVGQSVCLRKRAHTRHERINTGDQLSWVTVPLWQLDFAECFYIGTLCPSENFGANAWVRKAGTDSSLHDHAI